MGKNVVYLPQCHSTNDELSDLVKRSHVMDGTLLYTGFQTNGKGQRGNVWVSEPNMNLLCSLYLKSESVQLSEQFYLNLVTGLAAIAVLDKLTPSIKFLKWPNDIYVGENKVGGILIETNVKNARIESVIIGIGLNVNQRKFPNPRATSILLETNRFNVVEEIIEQLLCEIEKWYDLLLKGEKEELKKQYYKRLMWINEQRFFKSADELFQGEITGIDEYGRLIIERLDGVAQTFGIKEVEFIR